MSTQFVTWEHLLQTYSFHIWIVSSNHQLRIRKTCVDFYFLKDRDINIYFSIRGSHWPDFHDTELMFKYPVINLLASFILAWHNLVKVSQGSLWPIKLFSMPVLKLIFFYQILIPDEYIQLVCTRQKIVQIRNKVVC